MTASWAEPAGPSRPTTPARRPTVGNHEIRSSSPSIRACSPSPDVVTVDAASSGGPTTGTRTVNCLVPGATWPKENDGSARRREVRRKAAEAAAATRSSPVAIRVRAARA
ncbi:hypothetical protein ADL15_32020 [Actinoplanes awajinensis subsp. mycoplanecinus]|uniref:Uncharacterized protein n=1 Tax=Actinoplanes awajinensis subsp. mycoplanecinus TaxID=135947 RepID=A0A101JKD2_9ACTN|nr:hypothetical protein ADL15_32020 [Actinoplanes awajinensis subsp. mycoplanecinus]